jgi:predicted dienelactone hydrolase
MAPIVVKKHMSSSKSSRRVWLFGFASLSLLAWLSMSCSPSSTDTKSVQYNVGFTIYDFNYTNKDGEEELLTTAVWYPTMEDTTLFTYNNDFTSYVAYNAIPDKKYGPYPLIVFNHGAYASGIRSLPFTEHLASEGFIVASCDYSDTMPIEFAIQIASDRTKGEEGVVDPEVVLDTIDAFAEAMTNKEIALSYLEKFRLKKASFVIDSMLELNEDKSSLFYSVINENNIGMAGHSLGGLTALGLIGKHPEEDMKDERIKAALVVSAPAYPFETSTGTIDIPIMVIHGDLDLPRIMPSVLRRITYDNAKPPKFYLVVNRCSHFATSNIACKKYETILDCRNNDVQIVTINKYASAFFRRFLSQDLEAEKVLKGINSELDLYEYELE